mmetsp:Transcript_13515/g.19486  ORF Transcript_13515/g.19486 Transcript_13515/m.19486 type:complete len:156 (-) Transcript_13515:1043-1510(-)
MCCASVSFAAMATTVRWGSVSLSSPYLAFTRAIMQGIFALLYCAKFRINPFGPKEARAVLALRGVTGFMGATSYYFTLRFLPIGDANGMHPISNTHTCAGKQQLTSVLFLDSIDVYWSYYYNGHGVCIPWRELSFFPCLRRGSGLDWSTSCCWPQ